MARFSPTHTSAGEEGAITVTTAMWVAMWLSSLGAAGITAGTIKLRSSHLKRLAKCLDLSTLTEDCLVTWLEENAAHLSPNSRKSMISSFRQFFAWAHRTGRRADNPTAGLKPVKVPPGVPKPVPEHILAAALAQAEEQTRFMLLLGAFAGLRRAEIARVHSDDITDLGLVVYGKGRKMRLVPVHPELAPLLAAIDGWAFPSPVREGMHVSADYVESRITKVLPKPHTTHSLRHRFATRAYAASKDIRVVQQLLGHSSVATTQVYVQVDHDAMHAAVLAIA